MSDQANAPVSAPGGSRAYFGIRFVRVSAALQPSTPNSNFDSEPSVNDSKSTQGNTAEVDQYNPTKLEHPTNPDDGDLSLDSNYGFSEASCQKIVNSEDTESHNKSDNRAKKESETQEEGGTGCMRSFFGFIEEPMDAVTVVEACIAGKLNFFQGEAPYYKAKSGDVIVIPESNRVVRRWRDNIQWSPSRAFGPFLLYRQVEPMPKDAVTSIPLKYSFRRVQSNSAALEPTFSVNTLKAGTRLVENGLTKRTISLSGSDGQKHRVINYYTANDVIEMCQREVDGFEHADGEEVFQKPSKCPMLKEAMKSKGVNLNQILKVQNLYQESTSKSFTILSESPESEAPAGEFDTIRPKRQKQDAAKLQMPTKRMATGRHQTLPGHEPPRKLSQPQRQQPQFLIPFQPPNTGNPRPYTNSFYPRAVNYSYPPLPHVMGRPPLVRPHPLKQSPTHEFYQPRPPYHQQPQPEDRPVVYNLPAGATLHGLMPPPNYAPAPHIPAGFYRPPHSQYHLASWPMYNQHLCAPGPSYPPHPYCAPPPPMHSGYAGVPPTGMDTHAVGQQYPMYYVGPPEPETPSLPHDMHAAGQQYPMYYVGPPEPEPPSLPHDPIDDGYD
ncbi:Gti1/Pac2 family-domain-containing protein [Chytriomyces sp. MP71]|nr:Gti1/Pac2 family-domain-containing protein [Chytriomyces sp. MP71]